MLDNNTNTTTTECDEFCEFCEKDVCVHDDMYKVFLEWKNAREYDYDTTESTWEIK